MLASTSSFSCATGLRCAMLGGITLPCPWLASIRAGSAVLPSVHAQMWNYPARVVDSTLTAYRNETQVFVRKKSKTDLDGRVLPMNSIGGFIEDLCFKLGLLVTTRVSTRDKRKARPQRPSRPNTNRCPPSRGKLASGVCRSKYSLRVVESIIAYTIPLCWESLTRRVKVGV